MDKINLCEHSESCDDCLNNEMCSGPMGYRALKMAQAISKKDILNKIYIPSKAAWRKMLTEVTIVDTDTPRWRRILEVSRAREERWRERRRQGRRHNDKRNTP